MGAPDMVLKRLITVFLCNFIFATYFEAGTHVPQSGLEFWITEDDLELLLLLPPTSGMWRLRVCSAMLGFMWYWEWNQSRLACCASTLLTELHAQPHCILFIWFTQVDAQIRLVVCGWFKSIF